MRLALSIASLAILLLIGSIAIPASGLSIGAEARLASPDAQVVIDSPLDSSRLNSSTVTVQWHLTSPAWFLQYYLVRIDGGAWVNNSLRTSITLVMLGEGGHSVAVQARSELGENRTDLVEFEVDTVPPIVTSHSPTGGNVALSSKVKVGFSELMDQGSVALAGLPGTKSWSGSELTLTPEEELAPGQMYSIAVTGRDLAGNRLASFSWSFNASDEGTVLGEVMDGNNDSVSGATVQLRRGEAVVASTTTDANGAFHLSAPAGAYNLSISSPEIVTKELGVVLSPGQSLDLGAVEVSLAPDNFWIWILVFIVVGAVALLWVGRRRERLSQR